MPAARGGCGAIGLQNVELGLVEFVELFSQANRRLGPAAFSRTAAFLHALAAVPVPITANACLAVIP